jgi:hypothetical protein
MTVKEMGPVRVTAPAFLVGTVSMDRACEGNGWMEKYHIGLTDTEAATLAKIDLQISHRDHDKGHEAYKANKEPILALLKSLGERNAIPQVRLSFWSDSRFQFGRIQASRKGIFERNGCRGDDIYTHPHFIPYLRYFLFGTELPDEVIAAFEAKVGNPQWVSSSDILPIGKVARDLTRQHRLDATHAPEEFFKLCLDMGLGLSTAESVMRSVKQIRKVGR